MWHLFDRYKGIVWPKAGQMNLIARILNNLCQGTGIALSTPREPSPSSPVTIGIDTEWLDGYIDGRIGSGVSSVITGGDGIEVEYGEDGTVTINYNPDKPGGGGGGATDPCAHPGSSRGGGVGGGGAWGDSLNVVNGIGGVPAGGDAHAGSDPCNC